MVRGLSVGFGPQLVLDRIDASVPAGSALALVGPNGAGKTTLLRTLLGLVRPRSGSASVLGRSPGDALRDVAYVPQAASLDPTFPVSARQVVLMGRYRRVGWFRRPGTVDRQLAEEALDQVGLADRADERFGTLSGGERQRLLFARAIAQQARVLLLDEPFNGVDLTSHGLLLGAMARLEATGTTMVVATHDLAVVHHSFCDCCLLNRRLYAHGPPGRVLTAELLRAAYGSHAPAGARGAGAIG